MVIDLFDHLDPQGDQLTVTQPAKGGFTVHARAKCHGELVEVWLAPEAAARLAAVLTTVR